MHIPDGLLDLKAAGSTAVLSALGLGVALRRLRIHLPRRRVPLMGLAAAFIFTAQMLNFPVAGGTSGHLLGSALAAILLGPSAAVVVMTTVLVVQCLLFADGGVLSLGANVFNMALAAVLGGYFVFKIVYRLIPGQRGLLVATAFASWCSTVIASIGCAVELAWSGVAPWGLVFPAMVNIHMLIGLGEGLITTLVVAAVWKTRPDLLETAAPKQPPRPWRAVVVATAVLIAGLLLFVLPFASQLPDGLEHVAESLGFLSRAEQLPLVFAPMVDYQIPGIGSATLATCIAGLAGTLVAFMMAFLLAMILVPKSGGENVPSGET